MKIRTFGNIVEALGRRIVVDNIDKCGLLGRELLPQDRDIGQEGTIISLDEFYQDAEDFSVSELLGSDRELDEEGYVVFIVRLDNREIRQFRQCELEIKERICLPQEAPDPDLSPAGVCQA